MGSAPVSEVSPGGPRGVEVSPRPAQCCRVGRTCWWVHPPALVTITARPPDAHGAPGGRRRAGFHEPGRPGCRLAGGAAQEPPAHPAGLGAPSTLGVRAQTSPAHRADTPPALHCRRRSALAWSAGVSQPSSATTADLAGVPGVGAAAVTFPAAGCRSLPPEPARRRSRAAGRGGVSGGGSDGRCPSRPRAGGRPADSGQRILAEQTGGVLAWGGDEGPCRANAWLPRPSTASPAGEPHRPPCPLPRSPQQACSPTPAAAPPPALGTRRQAGACKAGHRARPGGPLQSRA